MNIEITGIFVMRLLLSGVFGAIIGFEREYRAKEAGIRTHFLVCIGSALFMIVSQWGFADMIAMHNIGAVGDLRLDPSRVASQVVSGIGFIGAGTIMMHREFVRGLTTAAGLWAASAIGLAVGGGLYTVGAVGTAMVLIGLEALRFVTRNIKSRATRITFVTSNRDNLIKVTNELNNHDYHITGFMVDEIPNSDRMRVHLDVRGRLQQDENQILIFMQEFPDLTVETVE